jgi:hypothetical protein
MENEAKEGGRLWMNAAGNIDRWIDDDDIIAY